MHGDVAQLRTVSIATEFPSQPVLGNVSLRAAACLPTSDMSRSRGASVANHEATSDSRWNTDAHGGRAQTSLNVRLDMLIGRKGKASRKRRWAAPASTWIRWVAPPSRRSKMVSELQELSPAWRKRARMPRRSICDEYQDIATVGGQRPVRQREVLRPFAAGAWSRWSRPGRSGLAFDAVGGVVAHPAADVPHANLRDAVRRGVLQTRLRGRRAGGAAEGAILDFGIDSRAWSCSAGALEAGREPTE